MRRESTYFLLRRLHSLSGVVPISVFLILHLVTNSYATAGRAAFTTHVGRLQATPGLWLIEWVGILLPLAFHAVLGIVMLLDHDLDGTRYPARSSLSTLQRITGVVALAFVAFHLWEYRLQQALGVLRWTALYDRLEIRLQGPVLLAVYLAGVSAAVFHFANGLWCFGVSWGLTRGPTARRRSAMALGLVGVAVWLGYLNVLAHFYTGGSLTGPRP